MTTSRTLHAWPLAAALGLLALPAHALEVDRIQVKSKLGEPLLAEIPIVARDAAELQGLQAQLASSITFARVGLARPQGAVSHLQFAIARDAHGDAVIRVSSAAPMTEDFLTFLIEVDWGAGRIVREYSVALDSAKSIEAPEAIAISEATVPPSNRIVRATETVVAPPTVSKLDADVSPVPVFEAARESSVSRQQPQRASVPLAGKTAHTSPARAAIPPAPAPQSVRRSASAAVSVAASPSDHPANPPRPASDDDHRVNRGDTLSAIAKDMHSQGHTLEQTMLALLQANPDAFAHNNINLLKRGVILRAPSASEFAQYDAVQAAALVRQLWRDGGNAPQLLANAKAPPASPLPLISVPKMPRLAQARFEIAPPSAGDTLLAGTHTGFAMPAAMPSADVNAIPVTRDGEVAELQAQVGEREKMLQRKQQLLLRMKDAELAARGNDRNASAYAVAGTAMLSAFALWLGWARWARRRAVLPSRRRILTASTHPRDADVSDVPVSDWPSLRLSADAATPAATSTHSPSWHLHQTHDPGKT